MDRFHFSDAPQRQHRVHRQPGSDRVLVDGTPVPVQALGDGRYRATLDGRTEQLHAVPDGDAVWVHWRGRAWRIERADATRASAAGGGAQAGVAHAPMPGVVVLHRATAGQRVSEGDALLVIESMKLQTTVTAPCSGVLRGLPLAVGQSFQRGAVLAQVQADGEPQ